MTTIDFPGPAPRGEFPGLDTLDALRADWIDAPTLTERHRSILRAIPADTAQEVLTAQARQVADVYYPLLDGVRSAATAELLRRANIHLYG